MSFHHCNYLGDLELEKKEQNGIRLYHLPDGQWVPSITSVTSFYNRQIFVKWRERIGLEEATVLLKEQLQEELIFTKSVKIIWRTKNWIGIITNQ